MIAHIGGLPVEESLALLAPGGIGLLIALQVTASRLAGHIRRGGRRSR